MRVELLTTSSPFNFTVSISVYNDGVPEGDEGFVILIGVIEKDLNDMDIGRIDVLYPVVLVRLLQAGNP